MNTQTAENMTVGVDIKSIIRKLIMLPDENLLTVGEFIDSQIVAIEEAEDVLDIQNRIDEPDIPLDAVLAKFEAKHGKLG